MKLTRFIKELEKLKAKYGNVDVNVFTEGEDGEEEPACIMIGTTDEDFCSELIICDRERINSVS